MAEQLVHLFAAWPAEQGRIVRILYSSPDWDDRPHLVQVRDRRVKTGTFPRDDTHELTLVLQDSRRRFVTVIPPETPEVVANQLLADMAELDASQNDHTAITDE